MHGQKTSVAVVIIEMVTAIKSFVSLIYLDNN